MPKLMRVEIVLKGKTPLLMNKMGEDELLALHTKEKKSKNAPRLEPRKEAERKLHQTHDGKPIIGADALFACLANAGVFIRLDQKRQLSTKTTTLLPAFLNIDEPYFVIETPGWEVDLRQGRNPNGGEAVCIIRPRFDNWKFKCHVTIDVSEIGENKIRELFDLAGMRIGLYEFRPQRRGTFGTFMVESWKELASTDNVDVPTGVTAKK